MIKAEKHWFLTPFLRVYIRYILFRNFGRLNLHKCSEVSDNTKIAIANHISWWDGFWALYLCNRALKRKLYVMMLEGQLQKNMILRFGGAFSIKKSSRGVLESLNYAIGLTHEQDSLVLMFPQGKLKSIYNNEFVFEPGIAYLLTKSEAHSVLFVVSLPEFGADKKPYVNIFYKQHTLESYATDAIAEAYKAFYMECMAETIKSAKA